MTPSDGYSERLSRLESPQSVMDRVERKLSSGGYDVNYERFSVERVCFIYVCTIILADLQPSIVFINMPQSVNCCIPLNSAETNDNNKQCVSDRVEMISFSKAHSEYCYLNSICGCFKIDL